MRSRPEPAGLQRERTALAWQRTAVSASVALLPPLAVDARLGSYRLLFPGLVAAIVAAVLLLGVLRRIRQLRAADISEVARAPWELMWRVAAVAALAAAGGIGTAVSMIRS
jgi:UPF0716 family protein affecting phage T7 exclusion